MVFVPAENADAVREAMFAAGGGHIGDYSHCSWSVSGTGQFLPHDGAAPTIGSVGTVERVPEERVEVIAPRGCAAMCSPRCGPLILRGARLRHLRAGAVTGDVGIGSRRLLAETGALVGLCVPGARALPGTSWGVRAAGDPGRDGVAGGGVRGSGDSLLDAVRSPKFRPTSPQTCGTIPPTSTGVRRMSRWSTSRTGPVSSRGVHRRPALLVDISVSHYPCGYQLCAPIPGMSRERAMKAEVGQQRSLLELAELDAELQSHRAPGQDLAEQQRLEAIQATHREANDRLAALQIALDDLDAQVTKFETEIDAVRQREDRDRSLLASGSDRRQTAHRTTARAGNPGARQSSLEDSLLEVMERREELQGQQAGRAAKIDELQNELSEAQTACDTRANEIDQLRHQCLSRRDELSRARRGSRRAV